MSNTITTTKNDIIWNYLATFFSIGYGVIVLPMILHFLTGNEVGLNYLFLTITSMVGLIDFGFSPQFGRNITYALSGAKKIEREGLLCVENGEPNYYLLGIVIEAAKYIYKRMSIFVILILMFVGTPYIYNVTHGFRDVDYSLIIWIIFCISSYLNIYFIYYRSLLTGSGKIYESSVSIILSKVVYILICGVMLLMGCGLFSVVIANLVAPLVQFLYSHIKFYTPKIRESLPSELDKEDIREAIVAIWYNAKKLGINSLGTFAILKMNLFFIGMFLPLSVVASFGVLTQIVQTLSNVSAAMFMAFLPQFSSLQVQHKYREIAQKLSFTSILYWCTFIIGGIAFVLLLPPILTLIKTEIELPEMKVCILYLAVMLLEGNHSNFAYIISTSNKIPYVKAGLLAGFAIAALTYLVLRYTSLGLIGVVLVQGIVQLSYNNWRWPQYVLDDLQIRMIEFLRLGVHEIHFKTQIIYDKFRNRFL